eukprot:13743167-Alexandrium_andersonii.AAC.1
MVGADEVADGGAEGDGHERPDPGERGGEGEDLYGEAALSSLGTRAGEHRAAVRAACLRAGWLGARLVRGGRVHSVSYTHLRAHETSAHL